MLSDKLKQAIKMIKGGDKQNARKLLMEVLDSDPSNEAAWLWFIDTLNTDSEKIIALQGFLKINPNSQAARLGLARLTAHQTKLAREALERSQAPSQPIMTQPAKPVEKELQQVYVEKYTPQRIPEDLTPQAEIIKPPSKPRNSFTPWLVRLLIVFLAVVFIGGGVYLYAGQAGLFQTATSACKCSDTDSYLLRIQDRVTRWMNNQVIYTLAETNGDAPQNTAYAQNLYDEENKEKVPGCLKNLHETLLLTFEYHIKYGEAIKSKDVKLISYYRNFENSLQDQLKTEFESLRTNLKCTP